MNTIEKIIITICIVILIAIGIACVALIIYGLINHPNAVSDGDSFNTALWVANPANPASPVGMLLR